jgi:hypothetical protein
VPTRIARDCSNRSLHKTFSTLTPPSRLRQAAVPQCDPLRIARRIAELIGSRILDLGHAIEVPATLSEGPTRPEQRFQLRGAQVDSRRMKRVLYSKVVFLALDWISSSKAWKDRLASSRGEN